MTKALPILTDAEVRSALPADDEAGFGALATPKGLLPLKALDVQTRIDGLLARTVLCQTFVNPFAESLEATYIFPLPDRAAVTHFRMEVAGRVIEGLLKERGQARRDYEQALQAGRRAAITEEERPGVFTLRVGNVQPGEEATIRLTLNGPLAYSDGEATFRFPLVVAPRYIPGTPLPGPSVGDGVAPDTDATPDASRITPPVLLPGFPNPVRLSLAVEVHSGGLPVGAFRSSLHAVVLDKDGDTSRIALQCGERLNRDFILRFRVGDQAVQTSLVLQPDEAGDSRQGTFLLTVVPPTGQAHSLRPRDVIFVLDRSGSMGGWKMVAARRALARMVDTLTERDRFTVYAFDNAIETPPAFGGTDLLAATDRNRFRAVEFLARIEARGGTEMAQPLAQAVRQLSSVATEPAGAAPRDPILVLVTDGQVGNEDQILRTLGQHVQGLRIFTLGIDQAVNAAFLRRLACLGGGSCELVESEDRLDEVMDKLHRRIGTPVLTGLHLEPDGWQIDSQTLTPARLPDLFAGAPLVVLGRYCGAARGSIRVQARDAAGRAWSESAAARSADNAAISAVWARAHVRELEDRYVIGDGDLPKLEKGIVQISLRFGVLCRFTAFVAVDVKEVVNPGGRVHRVTQPVEPAAGWAMLGTDRISVEETRRMLKISRHPISLDRPVGESEDSYFGDFIEDDGAELSVSASAQEIPKEKIELLLKTLTYRESEIIKLRYGLGDGYTYTLEEVGRIFKVTRERVRQIEAKAIRKLQRLARSHQLPEGEDVQSLLEALTELVSSHLPPPAPPSAGRETDLIAYRRRALELLQRLQGAAGENLSERLTELAVLIVRLTTLVEDLQSIGASAAEIQPLEELLKDLNGLMAARRRAKAKIEKLWVLAGQVLEAFAQARGTAGPDRKRKAL